ncbi:MAG: hypothetical protein U1F43_00725 [Myxococcota bacterium]
MSARATGWLVALALGACAPAPRAPEPVPLPNPSPTTAPTRPPEPLAQETPMATPTCRTSADMKRLDGKLVRLEGTYRRYLEETSMPRPGRKPPPREFLGRVVIEVEGAPSAYDEAGADEGPSEVLLGADARPADEVTRFADQPVVVEGRLVLDPDAALGDDELEQARPSGLPTLREVKAVRARP